MGEDFYFVDFKNIRCDKDVHEALKDGLHFTDDYGANLDALWDRLTDMMNYNAVITLQNFEYFEKLDAEEAQSIYRMFVDLKHYSDDFFYDKIKIYVSRHGIPEEIL